MSTSERRRLEMFRAHLRATLERWTTSESCWGRSETCSGGWE
jgi:hypothetical protein